VRKRGGLSIPALFDHVACRRSKEEGQRLIDAFLDANLDIFTVPGAQPYPGLSALGEDDAGIFFGGDADIMSGLNKLQLVRRRGSPRLFVIAGRILANRHISAPGYGRACNATAISHRSPFCAQHKAF
jgi:hypothetical protein